MYYSCFGIEIIPQQALPTYEHPDQWGFLYNSPWCAYYILIVNYSLFDVFSCSVLHSDVCVSDIFCELRRRHVIPSLKQAEYVVYYPSYHHRYLYHWETLDDIGALDTSTLYLHVKVLGGAHNKGRYLLYCIILHL